MARLISYDYIRQKALADPDSGEAIVYLQDIAEAPAADVAPVRRWIPVAERLPGNDDFVLVIASGKSGNITLNNEIELASFSMDEGWILEMWPEWEDPKVTYWMPLPEPPKEETP